MSSLAVKLGAKVLGKQLATRESERNAHMEDLYFHEVEVTTLGVRRTKKIKNPPPEGLTAEEEDILARVKSRAYKLDMCLFNCCGIRFGWSAVIGIIPVIGDFLAAYLAWTVIKLCNKVELPPTVNLRMARNFAIDFGIGLIPILGDIVDGVYKCNTRNVALLEEHLKKVGKKRNDARRAAAAASTSEQRAAGRSAGRSARPLVEEDYDSLSDQPDLHKQHRESPPRHASAKRSHKPQAANKTPETRGGWSFFGRGTKAADLEAGERDPPPKPARPGNTGTRQQR